MLNSWKIILEGVTVNVVISDVDAVMYVVLTEWENQKPYGEWRSTADCI